MRTAFSIMGLITVSLGGVAHADGGYFSESVGTSRMHDELAAYSPGGAALLLAFGYRRHHWALQFDIGVDIGPDGDATPVPATAPSLTSYGLSLKYIQPLSPHLDVYVRGRVMRGIADGELGGYAGAGLGIGAGVQLKGHLGWLAGALFVDASSEFYRLHNQYDSPPPEAPLAPRAIDANPVAVEVGWALGTDF